VLCQNWQTLWQKHRIWKVVLILVIIMFITLKPSSQRAVPHCMVFTVPITRFMVCDGSACCLLSSAYSCSPLKIDPEFSSRNVEHTFYSSQHAKPLLQLWIQALIKSTVCFLFISCSMWIRSSFTKVWKWHQISFLFLRYGQTTAWNSTAVNTLPVFRHLCKIVKSDFALSHLPVLM